MKFMVEFRIKPGDKDSAVEAFELRGPNRNPGVTFRGAWIGANTDVVYALVESADEAQVAKSAQFWAEQSWAHGDHRITPVIDIEQF
jgi:hypothetical protein